MLCDFNEKLRIEYRPIKSSIDSAKEILRDGNGAIVQIA